MVASAGDDVAMQIEQSARDSCIVLTLSGGLSIASAPMVQRAMLKCLAEQPDAVICDLSGVVSIDPVCATIFPAVAHRPRSAWPDSNVLLCCPRSEVARVLQAQRTPQALPVFSSLDEALLRARSRPPFLRERLHLVPTLEAITTARWFVGDVCRRWLLDGLGETAQMLAAEIVADVVLGEPASTQAVDLRLELRAAGLVIAVQSVGNVPAPSKARDDAESGAGLEAVKRATPGWGVRTQADGTRLVWCTLTHRS
jgi:anti-anti-sigma factor